MPDSPAPQQGAFKPITELQLQLVYVYTFSTLIIYFLPKSTSSPPPKKTTTTTTTMTTRMPF